MKIFLVGAFWHGRMTEYCASALNKLGHLVKVFYYNKNGDFIEKVFRDLAMPYLPIERVRKIWREAMSERLIREITLFLPDLILILKVSDLTTYALKTIGNRLKIPVVNWMADDPFRYPLFLEAAHFYDHIFLTDFIHIQQLNLILNRPASHLPNAAEPEVYKPIVLTKEEINKYECDLGLLAWSDCYGSGGILRARVLEQLAGEYKLKIYGDKGWKVLFKKFPSLRESFMGGPLSGEESNKFYNAARIVLNINHPQNKSNTGQRTFEIPCAGGFQLVDKKGGIEDLFKINEEIVCYETIDELKNSITYYLKNPTVRKEIADKARKRVLQSHTYIHRMKELLNGV